MIWTIIPIYNRIKYLNEILAVLSKHSKYATVVVNHGNDLTIETNLRSDTRIDILVNTNVGKEVWWTGAINLGVMEVLKKARKDDKILLLNDDIQFDSGLLRRFAELNLNKTIYGSHIVSVNSSQNNSVGCGIEYDVKKMNFKFSRYHKINGEKCLNKESGTLSGKGTLMPISVINDCGLFDEWKFPHYGADYSYFNKVKKLGYKLKIDEKAFIHDLEPSGWRQNVKLTDYFGRYSALSMLMQYKLIREFDKTQLIILRKIFRKLILK
jgi:GT2 family glycosyltransferase